MGNCAYRSGIDDRKSGILSPAAAVAIRDALSANNFFSVLMTEKNLSEQDMQKIVSRFRYEEAVLGQVIFSFGDPADKCYFLYKGGVDILNADGVKFASLPANKIFGEIGFINGVTRAASIVANKTSVLYSLTLNDFEAATSYTATAEDLTEVPIIKEAFKNLREKLSEIKPIIENSLAQYRRKEFVCSAATTEKFFYIIIRGTVRVSSPTNSMREVEELGSGDYFGEIAIINETEQVCEQCVQAVSQGIILIARITEKDFHGAFKPVKDLLMRRMKNARRLHHKREQFWDTLSEKKFVSGVLHASDTINFGGAELASSSHEFSSKKREVVTTELSDTKRSKNECSPVDCLIVLPL